MTFPAQPEELTSAWLTQMLRNNAVIGAENSVADFSHEIIGAGVGVVGMVVRISLRYASAENAGPASVVAKFAHPEAANRAIANNTNMYEREVDFFNKTAHNVATPMPKCYFASMNYDTGGNIVVIEDLAAYDLGDQVTGATPERVRMVIDALVPLHARYWNTWQLSFDNPMQINNDNYIEPFVPGFFGTWEMAIEKFADSFTPELIALMPKYVASLRTIMREMGNRPMTLIHGDVRMDNAMFGNGQPGLLPVVMIDWQNVMVSTPMQDMAWMLGTSVTTKIRRQYEEEFLQYYVDEVNAAGISDYSIEQARDDYDLSLLFIFNYTMIMAGAFDPANERGRKMAEEGLRRAIASCTDRNLFSRIPG